MQKASIASVCPYYGLGCGFNINTEAGKITGLGYMTGHPVNEGALCPKGNASLEIIYHHERLHYPMQRVDGKFERIPWSEADNGRGAFESHQGKLRTGRARFSRIGESDERGELSLSKTGAHVGDKQR